MLNNLPDNVIYQILYFLPNEDILKMKGINKNINESMNNSVFKQEIIYRLRLLFAAL
jgi:hypothetical protein